MAIAKHVTDVEQGSHPPLKIEDGTGRNTAMSSGALPLTECFPMSSLCMPGMGRRSPNWSAVLTGLRFCDRTGRASRRRSWCSSPT
jgi:hypothetical protein